VPAIPPPRAGLNPFRCGRIRIGGRGVISRANSSVDAQKILRFITHRVDYDKPDWLRCPQTQFKVRFTPSLQSSPRLTVRLSPGQFHSFYAAIGASQSFLCVSAKVD
jgi:hypothetical protein